MNKIRFPKLLAVLLVFSFSTAAQSQQTLDDQVEPIVASFKGKVSLFAKNLDTGETYALNLMKREQGRNAIGRSLYNVPMASKYGALDRLRSAVAILYTPKGKIAMAISCDDMPETMWSVDNPAYLLMSRLSEVIAAGLEKK